jgi:alpha-galactosidase
MKTTPRREKSATLAPRSSSAPGSFHRPVHVVILGASGPQVPELLGALLGMGADKGRVALVDGDATRLESVARLARKLVQHRGRDGWTVAASPHLAEVLPGAGYVIHCGGLDNPDLLRLEYDIPLTYGVDQCLGESTGPGGVFKALRKVPAWLETLAEIERRAPEAMVFNVAEPMDMLCLAAAQGSKLAVVGITDEVPAAAARLAARAGVPIEKIAWDCAGISGMSWFTRFERDGESLYPALKKRANADLAGQPADPSDAGDLVRKDLMVRLGAFPSGTSGRLSDSVPYYRKRKELIDRYAGAGEDGESGYGARRGASRAQEVDAERVRLLTDSSAMDRLAGAGGVAAVIAARERDVPVRLHATVPNSVQGAYSIVTNLPAAGVVQAACRIDRTGVRPVRFGALPRPLAALCDANMHVIEMAVRAAMDRSREAAVHALMLDPLTAAVCAPGEIAEMARELFAAEQLF